MLNRSVLGPALVVVVSVVSISSAACQDEAYADGGFSDQATTNPLPQRSPPASAPSDEAPTDPPVLISEDGGTVSDAGAGSDASALPAVCPPVLTGASRLSTCAYILPPTGGTIATANYYLQSVTMFGTTFTCRETTNVDHRGGLSITMNTGTSGTLAFVDQAKTGTWSLYATVRYDVDFVQADATTLSLTNKACATRTAPTAVKFTAGVTSEGKKTIVLRMPAGTRTADYRFVEF
jgi:hypothetical protein